MVSCVYDPRLIKTRMQVIHGPIMSSTKKDNETTDFSYAHPVLFISFFDSPVILKSPGRGVLLSNKLDVFCFICIS